MNSLIKSIIQPLLPETIRKVGDKYAVYPKSGGKRLGTHSSKKKAQAQLSAIEISKRKKEQIGEQKEITKVVALYPGRFQPFGPHHKAVYQYLDKQFDDAYILTSNKQGLPRHPLSFKQKKAHMSKMGVSTNKIFVETSPYRPKNLPKKFNSDTTAFVFVVGKKDASRLSGGKYFQDYKKNKNNLTGYEEHGYVLIAPHISVKAGGMEVSGTSMRELLGSPKYKEGRERRFKKMFGYFNKKIFDLMTNQFSKIFEQDFDAKDIVIYTPTHKMKKNKKWFDGKGKEILHDLEEDSGWPLGSGSTIGHGYPSEEDLKKWKKKTNKERSRTDSNKKYHFDPVNEDISLPVEIGDTVLMGRFKNKKVVSIVGNKEAEEFVENKENLYTYEIGFIPAGYEHRPDLISSVYYGTAIHWWMILLFNNITDPFEGLNVGDRILIPILSSR